MAVFENDQPTDVFHFRFDIKGLDKDSNEDEAGIKSASQLGNNN